MLTDSARENKSPKWDPCSRVGIYLDHSPTHAGSVALVLNPRTLHVSPQYHVVFDETFSTVPSIRDGTILSNWSDLVKESDELHCEDANELAKLWACEEDNIEDTDLLMNMWMLRLEKVIKLQILLNPNCSCLQCLI